MKYLAGLWLVACVACSGSSGQGPDAAVTADAPAGAPDPAQSSLTTSTDVAVAGVDQVLVTVTLRDGDGTPLPGVAVQLTATGSANTLSAPALTNASGMTTSLWSSTIAEAKQLTAVAGGVMIGTKTVTFVAGPAVQVVFLAQPSTTVAGASIAPAVTVAAEDTLGNIDQTVTGTVTMELTTTTTALLGTTSVAMSAGVATFSAIQVDAAGTGYQLRAKLGLISSLSTAFDVVAGDPDSTQSSITATPTSLEADGVEAATLVAHIVNSYGIAIVGAPVTFTATGTNNTLTQTTAVTDANGDATAQLTSTTPEVKVATAVAGAASVSTMVHFYPPSCVPQLPGPPGIPLRAAADPMLVADVDGDGHVDAVVGEPNRYIEVYRGRGDGTFNAPIDMAVGGQFLSILGADVDNDGRLDLVIPLGNTNVVDIVLGTGGGHFATPTALVLPAVPTHVVLGDFNRDGKLDIAASMLDQLTIELGAGNGTFTAGQSVSNVTIYDLATVDATGDGKLDLLYADTGGMTVLPGLGNGTFGTAVSSSGPTTGALVVGDFNSDGRADCAVAIQGWTLQPYLGNGDGTFTTVGAPVPTGQFNSSQLGLADVGGVLDVDGDGNVDMVLGEGESLTIMKGAGDGSFALSTVYAPDALRARVADVDEDGVPDVITMGRELLAVMRGHAGGTFTAPVVHAEPVDTSQLFLGSADFDGNGQRDLVMQSTLGIGALLFQSDGSLTDAAMLAETARPADLGVVDITGDGRADLVGIYASSSGTALRVAAGNGDGTFVPFTTQLVSPPPPTELHYGDFDRDGKQDVVLTSHNTDGFWIMRSQGDGTFGPPLFQAGADAVVTTDVNGDGTTDVISILTRLGADQLAVYLGDGAGGLIMPTVVYVEASHIGPVIVGDVDADGLGDVVMLEHDNYTQPYSIVVRRGLATGGLSAPLVTPVLGLPVDIAVDRVALADVTGDGVVDLVIRSSNYGLSIVPGYGDGYFRQHGMSYSIAYAGSLAGFVVSDDNRDTLPDVAFYRGLGVGLLFNNGCVP